MSLTGIVALTGVLIATVTDWHRRKVPNWLTVALVVAGLLFSVYNDGVTGLVRSFLGAALGFALLAYPFQMRWMGGGDVKLLMAVGALLGTPAVVWVALYGALAGGCGALIFIVYRVVRAGVFRAQLRLGFHALLIWLAQLSTRTVGGGPDVALPATRAALRDKFPYAFAIAAGTALVLWQGHP